MELLKTNKKRARKYLLIIIIGILLILLGVSSIVYNYYNNKKTDQNDNQLIKHFFKLEQEDKTTVKEKTEKENIIRKKNNNYIAVLEIPKINLKRGLVDKTSFKNNVNKNIYILKETTLPDEQVNSHIILAAHSGNSHVSFFKNVKKLDMKDKIYFYYKNIKYIYEVSNKYEIRKTGTANIKLTNTSDITLITCISGTNKQVVYVATLIEKIDY